MRSNPNDPHMVTLEGGPQDGDEVPVSAFTRALTHDETGAVYNRVYPEVWIFRYDEEGSRASR